MFLARRVMSLGLRMTLRHLQENVTSMQYLRSPVAAVHRKQFSLTGRSFGTTGCNNESDNSDLDTKKKLGEIQGKLQLSFTCKKCGTRNSNKIISKVAYNKGVVVVRCEGCKNNHLIADNLGWFGDPHLRNIEAILKKKGEMVRRIRNDDEGYFEAVAQEEVTKIQRLMKEESSSKDANNVEKSDDPIKFNLIQ
ncbi:hypothetical protein QAD02_022893 [Eretmocerus hayati]|uniref:Uncharacterized protein n=1 Tax=Eretmocerus hayati TaxID=131215 RepID=A0ACC2PU30_9HYME|nr:hypothetical protein QAD02_022893 [Eretmocerus hayati]